jgi:predicted transcriptional regulator of viral defense system
VSHRALSGRARQGDIERVRHGIYRLRDFPAHAFEDVTAACLWVGQDSAASHETALAVHGLSDATPVSIHVTVPHAFGGKQSGVIVHRVPLSDLQRETYDGVPVTTIARTFQDIAASSDPALVHQALEQAITRGLSQRQLRKLARDSPALAPLIVGVLTDQ